MINPAQFGRLDPAKWKEYPAHYTQDIWPEKLPSKPSQYGDNAFHGRTHPEIIRVACLRYTKPGDIVYDPFAGSGTTLDVCIEMENECIAFDIKPARSDIIQADARYALPTVQVDLAVIHPPYMSIIKYGEDDGLSTDNRAVWRYSMSQVLLGVWAALKPGHVAVVIVGVLYSTVLKEVVCLDHDVMALVGGRFRLLGRVVRPYGETKGGVSSGKKNENLWTYRRLKWGLWSLNQDIILWLQRLP